MHLSPLDIDNLDPALDYAWKPTITIGWHPVGAHMARECHKVLGNIVTYKGAVLCCRLKQPQLPDVSTEQMINSVYVAFAMDCIRISEGFEHPDAFMPLPALERYETGIKNKLKEDRGEKPLLHSETNITVGDKSPKTQEVSGTVGQWLKWVDGKMEWQTPTQEDIELNMAVQAQIARDLE